MENEMRTPSIRYADDIKQWDCTAEINGEWVLARAYSTPGIHFLWRLQLAWDVFTGKYDALAWNGDQ